MEASPLRYWTAEPYRHTWTTSTKRTTVLAALVERVRPATWPARRSCDLVKPNSLGFLNRVHKFDSCRGHHHRPLGRRREQAGGMLRSERIRRQVDADEFASDGDLAG